MVQIRNYPARNGDAFLVKAIESPFVMLIDGGYAETFHEHIRSDLVHLAASGRELDLVVSTHVDADHISGLLSFFRLNGHADEPDIIRAREVLHNSFRGLVNTRKDQPALHRDDFALLGEIRRRGYPPPTSTNISDQEISARQGSSLAQLLRDGRYRWNTHNGKLCVGGDGLRELALPNAHIKILGPSKMRLEALKNWWISEIRRLGLVGMTDELDDVFEFICAHEIPAPVPQMISAIDADLAQVYFPDDSITNGSSISLLVELEASRLLFLGDAWADEVVKILEPSGPSVFDAIKISHHGSSRNTSIELLALVDSPHFFISTNGDKHAHPDFAVLKAIVDRPAKFHRTLHFNYSTPSSRKLKNHLSKTGAAFTVDENQTDWVTLNQ